MNDECPVCLVQKDLVTLPTCTHGICEECTILLDKFQIQKCPICRSNFGNTDNPETDGTVVRRRRRNLSRIEYLKRRQIIKGRQRRSRDKKEGRNRKLQGEYF
tara:strand:+ start:542 stop:850 length:309 start_codon:yes stop_codon:yes gene_type:complete